MKAAKCLTLSLAAVLLVHQGASGQTCPPDGPPVPVGTAFTYQGLLTCTPGAPVPPKLVDDTCNFKFDLYDCQTDGNLIATAQTVRDLNDPNKTLCAPGPKCPVTVIDGHFAVQLEFGNVYDGNARFLEITVECPTPCPSGQATLAPRSELTPVPYALFAQKGTGPVDDKDWSGSGSGTMWTTNLKDNVGIGTDGTVTPILGKLDVVGNTVGNVFVYNHAQPTRTYEIRASGRQEVYNTNDFVHFSGSNVLFVTGAPGGGINDDFFIAVGSEGNKQFILEGMSENVGIGDIEVMGVPSHRLDVGGQVRIRDLLGVGIDLVTADAAGVLHRNAGGLADNDWKREKPGGPMYPIDLADDVGIGIAAPQARLHVDKHFLAAGSAAKVTFSNNAPNAFTTRGLLVKSIPIPNPVKGTQIGIEVETGVHSTNNSQDGDTLVRLAESRGFDSSGNFIGVRGTSTVRKIKATFSNTTHALGGRFVVSAPTGLNLVDDGSGSFWIGGSYNEVVGTFNQAPAEDRGAIAAVIGIDNNTGTAKSFAGFFKGDVCIRGNLCVDGDITLTGGVESGVCTSECAGCTCVDPSDRRLKDHIEPIAGGLDKVTRLRGVSFQWRRDEFPKRNFRDGQQIGLIAQEVAEVLPEVVVTDPDGYKGIQYGKLVAVLVEAIKEQDQMINSTRSELGDLKRRLAAVERAVGVEEKPQRANSAGLGGALTATALALAALIGFMMHAHSRRGGVR